MASMYKHLMEQVAEAPASKGLGIICTATVATLITVAFIKRLYYRNWHPLSRFRGPPEAASSRHWIYKVTDRGFPEEDLEKLHKKYQTQALRIGPNELHITDVHMYKVIYSQSKPFPKHAEFYEAFNTPHTVFTEIDAGMHKERRRLLNPFFSRAGVFKLEPIIHEKAEILMNKIRRLENSHTVNVYDAFRCLTTEVIMEFAFAKSANMLEESETTFESWFLVAFDAVARSIWKMQEWPIARKALGVVPMSFIGLVDPNIVNVLKMLKFAESCLEHYEVHGNTTTHPVVFENLFSLPHDYKVTEALDILIAGADTTASTLTAGFMHILSNPTIYSKLADALRAANISVDDPSAAQLQELEKIPYLTACVKESLRIAMPVPGRLPRVVPNNLDEPFVVEGQVIPPGTVVSMSTYTMHTSEEVWGPDARAFNPDRWLQPEAKSLEQYLCTFSKGVRMCLGQNVAYAEVTIVMAYLFRNFDIKLPPYFRPPERKDLFTMEYSKPGLPLMFSSVEAR
ncbi:cytochrome P450 [Aspergillus vadensis CBS 113365]|uniref:Cytochrome P450 n=1 Tax=Aspergillus vadensis (strain CBS 113365 / IMI 142717 / IBT 24658) TaxID=1448311 RepID=A0A319BX49_ASPVC|nr:cytochrome P450 [Aspergillus vadensis CBS 113365]PYH67698.1 cytochrome P450 [Aspergillus vadensis CBS 113365]